MNTRIFFIAIVLWGNSFHAMERAQEQQKEWRQEHVAALQVYETVDLRYNLTRKFDQLAIAERPQPDMFSVYIKDVNQQNFQLVFDPQAPTDQQFRFYGSQERFPNVISISNPADTHSRMSFTNPQSSSFSGGRSMPTAPSSSYEAGCYTYYYTTPRGDTIRFDRGHGIAHNETRNHQGKISTKDSENYVPQNQKYNSPLRRDLELKYHGKDYTYKEISVYHPDSKYHVTIKDKKAPQSQVTVDIPEGFVFMVFKPTKEIESLYYFPNFIDYDAVKTANKSWFDIYKITNLASWFVIPHAHMGDRTVQDQQITLAEQVASDVIGLAPTLFSALTQEQMPSKARMALLLLLLEWNLQAAASLEYIDHKNKLTLASFYTKDHIVYELDARTPAEKTAVLDRFMNAQHTPSGLQLIDFLRNNTPFTGIQGHLQKIVKHIGELNRHAPVRVELGDLAPDLFDVVIGAQTHNLNVFALSDEDIVGFKEILGGVSTFDLKKAQKVLSVIESRFLKSVLSINELLKLLEFYHDDAVFKNYEKFTEWQQKLEEKSTQATFDELKSILDFYGYRDLKDKKEWWFGIFIERLQQNETIENYYKIARWCLDGSPAFLLSMEEYSDYLCACHMLALEILRGIEHLSPNTYQTKHLFDKLLKILHLKRWGYTYYIGMYGMTAEHDKESIILPLEVLLERTVPKPQELGLNALASGVTGSVIKGLARQFYAYYERTHIDNLKAKNTPEARLELARCYKEGRSVSQSLKLAQEIWLSLDDNAEAAYQLGFLIHEGKVVGQSYDRAYKYFLKAAQKNHSQALFYVGMYCKEGFVRGLKKRDALSPFQRAAADGVPLAHFFVGSLLCDRSPTRKEKAQQIRCLKHGLLWFQASLMLVEDRGTRDLVTTVTEKFGTMHCKDLTDEELKPLKAGASAALKKIKTNALALRAYEILRSMGLESLYDEAETLILEHVLSFQHALDSCMFFHHIQNTALVEQLVLKALTLIEDYDDALRLIRFLHENKYDVLKTKAIAVCIESAKNSLEASCVVKALKDMGDKKNALIAAEKCSVLAHTSAHFNEVALAFSSLQLVKRAETALKTGFKKAKTSRDFGAIALTSTSIRGLESLGKQSAQECADKARDTSDLLHAADCFHKNEMTDQARQIAYRACTQINNPTDCHAAIEITKKLGMINECAQLNRLMNAYWPKK